MSNADAWDRIAQREQVPGGPPTDAVEYGPSLPTERELRLLGDVAGRRVLDLGCGAGQAAIALARQGATVIAVDGSLEQLGVARARAEHDEARIEWHQTDLADLAFLRADSIDLAFSAHALAEVEDLSRLFRQVHRVLRPNAAFVFSHEHPLALATAHDGAASGTGFRRSLFDASSVVVDRAGEPVTLYPRSIADEFTALHRAGFRVDMLLEPPPPGESRAVLPSSVIWRARKEGA